MAFDTLYPHWQKEGVPVMQNYRWKVVSAVAEASIIAAAV